MENKHSPKFLRQRKFMLVLPVLVIPFLTMAFVALGGGSPQQTNEVTNKGLNLELPDAHLKDDQHLDKLSFYKEADQNSLKREELLRNDPYYKDSVNRSSENSPNLTIAGLNSLPYSNAADTNEQKIYRKINELNQQINAPVSQQPVAASQQTPTGNEQFAGDVDRLQTMMQSMSDNGSEDPEMQQLNRALEKILDIQNPDRVKEKLRAQSVKNKQAVFAISDHPVTEQETFLQSVDTTRRQSHNGFYGENNSGKTIIDSGSNTVAAVVNETQTLSNGSTIKLRLTTDVFIDGKLIPKGSFIYGTSSLEDERLLITVTGIRYDNNLLPVALAVYDMDGLAGIHIPGSINRDVAKQSADQSLQSVELLSLDPSLKMQAASAGISAAKSLLGRKVKLVKVTIKAGYQILLKDNNKQNH
jgi:conjugative transposon TraM protein